jgi:hypothetical protein
VFADQVGVGCRPSNPLPTLGGFDCGQGRRLSTAEVKDSVALQFRRVPASA